MQQRKDNVIYIGTNQERLLTPYNVQELTGLSYGNALRVTKLYGIHIGNRYFITRERLQRGIADLHEREEPQCPNTKHGRPEYT